MKRLIWDRNKYPLDFFGIPTGNIPDSFMYDELIMSEYRKDNMIAELDLGVRYKTFSYKGKIEVDYSVNSHGYRGPELMSVDMLTSGCSQSFGVGVPEKLTWTNMLADGITYNNLSYPGNSTSAIVEDIFKHFDMFGHPKYLRLLLPDFLRFKFIKAANQNVFIQNSRGSIGEFVNTVSDADREVLKYEKMPIAVEKIMPVSVPFRNNLMAIKMLEKYVEQTNIDFKWATWHNELNMHLKRFDYGFHNYVSFNIDNKVEQPCHLNIKEIDPRFFDIGTDPQEHMGSHAHAHYAELFAIDKNRF